MNRTLYVLLAAAAVLLVATESAKAQTGTLQGKQLFLYDGGLGPNLNRIGLTTPPDATLTADYTLSLPPTNGNANDILYTPDGTGTLDFTDGNGLFWRLLGNSSTTPWNGATGNFVGTSDAQDLVIRAGDANSIQFWNGSAGGTQKMILDGNGLLGVGTNPSGLYLVEFIDYSGIYNGLYTEATGGGLLGLRSVSNAANGVAIGAEAIGTGGIGIASDATDYGLVIGNNTAPVTGIDIDATGVGILVDPSATMITGISVDDAAVGLQITSTTTSIDADGDAYLNGDLRVFDDGSGVASDNSTTLRVRGGSAQGTNNLLVVENNSLDNILNVDENGGGIGRVIIGDNNIDARILLNNGAPGGTAVIQVENNLTANRNFNIPEIEGAGTFAVAQGQGSAGELLQSQGNNLRAQWVAGTSLAEEGVSHENDGGNLRFRLGSLTDGNVPITAARYIRLGGGSLTFNDGSNTLLNLSTGDVNINTAGTATTDIGNTASGGAVSISANNDITIDVGATTNNLVLNNIDVVTPITDLLWITASNQVRRTAFTATANEGIQFESGAYRLGHLTQYTGNPIGQVRYVNVGAGGNLVFTNGAADVANVANGGNLDATLGLDVTNADLTVGVTNFTVDDATGNTDIAGSLTVDGNTTLGDADLDVNNVRGATNINTSASNAATTIGALTNTGAVSIAANNDITIDVTSTANDLVLNNIDDDNTTVNVLMLTGTNSGNVRTQSLNDLVDADQGLVWNETGTDYEVRLGSTVNGTNPVSGTRFVNVDGTLSFTTDAAEALDFSILGATDNVQLTKTSNLSSGILNATLTSTSGVTANISIEGVGTGVGFNQYGVVGRANYTGAASAGALTGPYAVGLAGTATPTGGDIKNWGIQGISSAANSGQNTGVWGDANSAGRKSIGVVGASGDASSSTAAQSFAWNNTPLANPATIGVLAHNNLSGATDFALYAVGNTNLSGALTQTGASNQVTFAGNVDANNGLDVNGDLNAFDNFFANDNVQLGDGIGTAQIDITSTGADVTITVPGSASNNDLVLNGIDANNTLTTMLTLGAGNAVRTTALNDVAWLVGGNTLTANGEFGTNSAHDVIIESSGIERFRLTAAGAFTQAAGGGQVTFTGNVDATSGLDVTNADLTVGGSNFTVAVGTGNTDISGDLTVDGSTTLGDADADVNTLRGVTNINTAATNAATNIGATTNTGSVAIASNSSVTIDVTSTSNNLVLNNIDDDNTTVNVLTLTGTNSGNVRTQSLNDLVDADQGLVWNQTGTDYEVRLGHQTAGTGNPIVSSRFINVGAGGTLTATTAAGTAQMLVLNNTGAVGISTAGTGTTTIGNASAGTVVINAGGAGNDVDVDAADDITLNSADIAATGSATVSANAPVVNINTTAALGNDINIGNQNTDDIILTMGGAGGGGDNDLIVIGEGLGTGSNFLMYINDDIRIIGGDEIMFRPLSGAAVPLPTGSPDNTMNFIVNDLAAHNGTITLGNTGAGGTVNILANSDINLNPGAGTGDIELQNVDVDNTVTRIVGLTAGDEVRTTNLNNVAWLVGSNTFTTAGPWTFGTNSNHDIVFETNNTTRFTLTNAGAFTQAAGGGQVTFTGNVDATAGLDVTVANLTVGATNFIVTPAGNTTIEGTLNANGNTTIGDADADVTTIRGDINLNTTNTAGAAVDISTTALANTTTIGNNTVGNTINLNSPTINAPNLPATGVITDELVTTDGTALRTATVATMLGGTPWLIGGNTVGANGAIGTNDAFDLQLETSGTTRFTIPAGGGLTQSGAGQVTFTGNVDATNGLDVTGADLNVTTNSNLDGVLNANGNVNLGNGIGTDVIAITSSGVGSDVTITTANDLILNGIDNDNTDDRVLVIDGTTNVVSYRDASTLVGADQGLEYLSGEVLLGHTTDGSNPITTPRFVTVNSGNTLTFNNGVGGNSLTIDGTTGNVGVNTTATSEWELSVDRTDYSGGSPRGAINASATNSTGNAFAARGIRSTATTNGSFAYGIESRALYTGSISGLDVTRAVSGVYAVGDNGGQDIMAMGTQSFAEGANTDGLNIGVLGYARNGASNIGIGGAAGASDFDIANLATTIRTNNANAGVTGYSVLNGTNDYAVAAYADANNGRALLASATGNGGLGLNVYAASTGGVGIQIDADAAGVIVNDAAIGVTVDNATSAFVATNSPISFDGDGALFIDGNSTLGDAAGDATTINGTLNLAAGSGLGGIVTSATPGDPLGPYDATFVARTVTTVNAAPNNFVQLTGGTTVGQVLYLSLEHAGGVENLRVTNADGSNIGVILTTGQTAMIHAIWNGTVWFVVAATIQ